MKRSDNRILTTHVGSLIRPKAMLDAGKPGEPAYEAALKNAVNDIVAAQVKAGIDIPNDGEFGKAGWAHYMLARLTGFEQRRDKMMPANWLGRDRVRFKDFMADEFPRGLEGAPQDVCVGPVTYRGHDLVRRDLDTLKAAAKAAGANEVFFTTVAPASIGYDAINEHYASEEDYVFAVAKAAREEYLEIYKAGVILQVDDAVLANMYDHLMQQSPQRYREWAELRVAALNHALEGIPEDRIRYHICFGSWHVPHVADAPLEAVVDLMLKVRAGAYSIEAANVRHEHEWYVWEKTKLPAGKILLPGVVTHHTTTVEHPRLVKDRIMTYAKLVGRENVIASTDCGFAQVETIRRTHPQVMWAKLESLAEGARLASQELWGTRSNAA